MPLSIYSSGTEPFDEAGYLVANPDVANAVRAGQFQTGRHHYDAFGRAEDRRWCNLEPIREARERKNGRIRPLLRSDLPVHERDGKFDYLSSELRKLAAIEDTAAVSSNSYDARALELIGRCGLVLDCGAGSRDVYYENVVNFEIADYVSTDVLGVGEELPFRDGCFDAVLSLAVLEHVKDPVRCAQEIVRVLKPGGELYAVVPFLQPLHGYPHHYFNMSHQGLRTLFPDMEIGMQFVPVSGQPVWSLTWFLQRWEAQLGDEAKARFRELRVADLMGPTPTYLDEDWVTTLGEDAQFELASTTALVARKPAG